jgi:hypothetical protein
MPSSMEEVTCTATMEITWWQWWKVEDDVELRWRGIFLNCGTVTRTRRIRFQGGSPGGFGNHQRGGGRDAPDVTMFLRKNQWFSILDPPSSVNFQQMRGLKYDSSH